MKVPKYMKQMIMRRAQIQGKANSLQTKIDEWCEKHNVDTEYNITHICLYTEPVMAALRTIKEIEDHSCGKEAN